MTTNVAGAAPARPKKLALWGKPYRPGKLAREWEAARAAEDQDKVDALLSEFPERIGAYLKWKDAHPGEEE